MEASLRTISGLDGLYVSGSHIFAWQLHLGDDRLLLPRAARGMQLIYADVSILLAIMAGPSHHFVLTCAVICLEFPVLVPLLYPRFRPLIVFYIFCFRGCFGSFSEAFRRLGGIAALLWY